MTVQSGNIKKFNSSKAFEIIPRSLLQDENLSLEAIGLLCNLQSYPDDWKIYKTELYKRYKKNKRTSITRMWKELIEFGYMLEFKKRVGRKYIYQYIFSLTPFSEEETKTVVEDMKIDGFFWDVDFELSEMNCSKPTDNIIHTEDNTHKHNIATEIATEKISEPKEIHKENILLGGFTETHAEQSFLQEDCLKLIEIFSSSLKNAKATLNTFYRAKKKSEKEYNVTIVAEHMDQSVFNRSLKKYYQELKAGNIKSRRPLNYLFGILKSEFDKEAYRLMSLQPKSKSLFDIQRGQSVQVPLYCWA